MRHRQDIDGLRAIAVLSVLGFHAFPIRVTGGFVGVDVFFVISGFLISSTLFKSLDQGRLDFAEFYARRIRRIFPALFVVLAGCAAFGAAWLLYDDYTKLGRHIVAGAGFASNFVLWSESGYFDTDSDLKPLLHLWSLGIEEQFYFAWPLVLFLAYARRARPLRVTCVIAAASFALNVALSHINAVTAFYFPFTRFWELLLGAVWARVALDDGPQVAPRLRALNSENVRSAVGVLLIAAGVFLLDKQRLFPGWWALLPTVGAVLTISAGPRAWINRHILAFRPLTFVGRISYPLYLWHWPLLSFCRLVELDPSIHIRLATLAVAFVLAALTYQFIETPIRAPKRGTPRRPLPTIAAGLVAMAALLVVGGLMSAGRLEFGLQRRSERLLSFDYRGGRAEKDYWGSRSCFRFEDEGADFFDRNHCLDETFAGRPTVFIVGDSHSAYLSEGLRPYLSRNRVNVGVFSAGWCTPLSLTDKRPSCAAINRYVLDKIRLVKPEVVLFFAHHIIYGADYESSLTDGVLGLKRAGAQRVIFVGQIPTWKRSLPSALARGFLLKGLPLPSRTWQGVTPESLAIDERLKGKDLGDGVTYVSLRDFLCNDEGCLTSVGADETKDLVVFDYGHLTAEGARYVTERKLGPLILAALSPPTP